MAVKIENENDHENERYPGLPWKRVLTSGALEGPPAPLRHLQPGRGGCSSLAI
jgi:hypothetical protein